MQGKIAFSAPANISLIKNFGSYRNRNAGNPSLSMSLEQSRAAVELCYDHIAGAKGGFQVTINGEVSEYLHGRISTWLQRILPVFPWVGETQMNINVVIRPELTPFVGMYAAMAALACCVTHVASHLGKHETRPNPDTISSLALLDSENAARSVFGGFVEFGKTPALAWSSDRYATQYQREAIIFNNLNDSVLTFFKATSALPPDPATLLNHPYAEARLRHAQTNTTQFLRALDDGQWDLFERIVENEALTLCGLLLASPTNSFLPSPDLIACVRRLCELRLESSCPVAFTFDRELRLHLLYPPKAANDARSIINELKPYCGNILHDRMGNGVTNATDDSLAIAAS